VLLEHESVRTAVALLTFFNNVSDNSKVDIVAFALARLRRLLWLV
jgi:hypothetical protein